MTHRQLDAFEMIQSIWHQKKLLAVSALFFAALGAAYAFSVTPEYEVGTVLRPAALNDLDALNRTDVYSLPPSEALNRVGAALDSYETRLGYFRSSPALRAAYDRPGRSEQQAFEKFNSTGLKLILPDPKKPTTLSPYVGLEMVYERGLDGQKELNGLVAYAIQSEKAKITADLNVIIANRIQEVDAKLAVARADYDAQKASLVAELNEADNLKRAELQDGLRALRVQLKMNREDRIAQLGEAIAIAKSLGIKKPSSPSALGEREVGTVGNVFRTEVNNQQVPLYFMGSDALEAERDVLRRRSSDDFTDSRVAQIHKDLMLLDHNRKIEVLRQRKDDELFLKGIESLRAESARLKHINTDMSALQLVSIDQLAVEPLSPIKPKKGLIIALGLVFGLLAGALVAAARYLVLNRSTPLEVATLHKMVETEAHASLPVR